MQSKDELIPYIIEKLTTAFKQHFYPSQAQLQYSAKLLLAWMANNDQFQEVAPEFKDEIHRFILGIQQAWKHSAEFLDEFNNIVQDLNVIQSDLTSIRNGNSKIITDTQFTIEKNLEPPQPCKSNAQIQSEQRPRPTVIIIDQDRDEDSRKIAMEAELEVKSDFAELCEKQNIENSNNFDGLNHFTHSSWDSQEGEGNLRI